VKYGLHGGRDGGLCLARARHHPHLYDRSCDGACRGLRIISYGYVFYAWAMVMMQAFNGAGDTATPTWINFWLFQIPLAWLLAMPLGLGPTGVFVAIALSYSLSAVVGIVLFRRGTWKEKKV
jgi:Na+-driven multidrug efflux pump